MISVVIATHERIDITSVTIHNLQNQSLVPDIILVVSKKSELEYYKKIFPTITVVKHRNKPIGGKWQAGVNAARKKDASAVIILGSDDILSKGYIEACQKKLDVGIDLFGLKQWFIYWEERHKLYLFHYNSPYPLGGGRMFSKRALDKINWRLYRKDLTESLDRYSYSAANKNGIRTETLINTTRSDTMILAYKGGWPVKNPIEGTFKSPSAKLQRQYNAAESERIARNFFNIQI